MRHGRKIKLSVRFHEIATQARNDNENFGLFHIVMLSLSKHLAVRRISFSPISFYFLSSFKGWAFETLNASFPFPQVFSLSPFPLTREPTVPA